MATSSAPVVPLELQLDIIDCLSDDERSLRNGSVVCQAWLPHTRSHLWKAIALVPNNDGKNPLPVLAKPFQSPWSCRITSMADAISFFVANPDIAKFVKWIGIDGFTGVAVGTFSSLLTALPNAVRIEVINTEFLPHLLPPTSHADEEAPGIKPVYAHTLDKVRIENCNIVERDHVDTLLQVLGSLSARILMLDLLGPLQFRHHELQRDEWIFDPAVHLRHDVPRPAPPRVGYLDVDRIHPTTLRYLFQDSGICQVLNVLLFSPNGTIWTYDDLVYMANTLLPLVSSTLAVIYFALGTPMGLPLDTLQASPEGQRDLDAAFTRIALSCAPMKHFNLMVSHYRTMPLDYSYLFDGFLKVIQRMPSDASLKCYTVCLMVDDAMGVVPPRTVTTMEVMKGYDWAGLERVLLAKARREVKLEVMFLFIAPHPSKEDKQGMIKNLEERMPELVAEKRLEVIIFEQEGWNSEEDLKKCT